MPTPDKSINICFSSDNNYAQHLGVALYSFLKHHSDEYINFYVLDGGISESNKKKILELTASQNCSIEFISINESLFDNYKFSNRCHFTPAVFYRFKIPELFSHLEKVLYLDVDIVSLGNIKDFYDANLEQYCLGMVSDWGEKECAKHLGIENYYNSGVILFNIQQCLKKDLFSILINELQTTTKKLKYPDQDIINLTCQKTIKKFDPIYNAQVHPTLSENVRFIKSNLDRIKILHYTSSMKPWKNQCMPFEDFYFDALENTPWKSSVYKIKLMRLLSFTYYMRKKDNKKTFYFIGIPYFSKETISEAKNFYILGIYCGSKSLKKVTLSNSGIGK